TTSKMYTCKKFLKKDGRKVRKAAKNEIFILKMVKHPNILQLVDVYETRKEYFLFLELATGREVFDWILDQGYYSEKDTSNVIRQVMEAVAYLHSLNIVHRNLKLENLVYYNRLKLSKIVISDFHLAKLENGLIKEPCGTPEYLAPEVVGRQRYGRPVDCWALGVIMYILVTTIMKRLRAPEHQNTDSAAVASAGAPNPAGGAQENLQAPSEASTTPANATAPDNTPVATASPAGLEAASAETQAAAAGASAHPPAEPAQPGLAAEQGDANSQSRCNGEAPANPPLATHTGDQQNG
uniref:CaM kinase-like vesicle-associated b n=1 Tax=Astyanax mexicanus TaxID=7994 RepID=A0A8B9HTA4_ASTMX